MVITCALIPMCLVLISFKTEKQFMAQWHRAPIIYKAVLKALRKSDALVSLSLYFFFFHFLYHTMYSLFVFAPVCLPISINLKLAGLILELSDRQLISINLQTNRGV